MANIEQCLEALQAVLGSTETEIALHEPQFQGNEWKYVKSCLDSGWVSSVGAYVTLFEEKISEYTGIPYVIAAVNGTAALHVCMILAGVQPQDEVLIPSLTFVATANAIAYCNAIPHFIDSNRESFGIDIPKLRHYLEEITYIKNDQCFNKATGNRIAAIVPVHIFGHPVDIDALQALCNEFHLTMVEDASESLGSFYKGKHTGGFGELGALSFNGNKLITTGGGGAILTRNADLAKKAKHLTTTAKRPHRWEFYHDEVAYNYRLPNINAAIGCAQLEQLPTYIEYKRKLAHKYQETFETVSGATILSEPAYATSNYWLNALVLKTPNKSFVDNFIDRAHQLKFNLRGLWTPLDTLPMYKDCPKMDLSTTHALYEGVIALPSSVGLMMTSEQRCVHS